MTKGKYLSDLYKSIENKSFNVDEAIKFIVDKKREKFDETIEISMNLGIDPRHADQMVRGVVSLPNGNGKAMKIAVFAKDKKAEEAKQAGADVIGAEDLAEDMQKGNLNYDRVIATPDMMGVVGKIGKVLGPKGLMPNPKLGSVTNDLAKAVSDAKSGQVEIRNDKDGNIGVSIGKKSFDDEKLVKNYNAIIDALEKEKANNTLKGDLVKQAFVTSSMGVSYKVKLGKSI